DDEDLEAPRLLRQQPGRAREEDVVRVGGDVEAVARPQRADFRPGHSSPPHPVPPHGGGGKGERKTLESTCSLTNALAPAAIPTSGGPPERVLRHPAGHMRPASRLHFGSQAAEKGVP